MNDAYGDSGRKSAQAMVGATESRDIAVEFVRLFCAGDLSGIEAILAADVHLKGPLFEFTSREAYLASLRESPPERASCEILDVTESPGTVSVYYVYKKSTAAITIAQRFKIKDGKIRDILLVFDASRVR